MLSKGRRQKMTLNFRAYNHPTRQKYLGIFCLYLPGFVLFYIPISIKADVLKLFIFFLMNENNIWIVWRGNYELLLVDAKPTWSLFGSGHSKVLLATPSACCCALTVSLLANVPTTLQYLPVTDWLLTAEVSTATSETPITSCQLGLFCNASRE